MFEWPTGCSLWKEPVIEDMISQYHMIKHNVHGCMLGVVSIEGKPMKKPWTIYSTMEQIQMVFKDSLCDGSHEHQIVQGKNTSRTSSYPWDMTDKVHRAIRLRVDSQIAHVNSMQESGKGEGSVACPSVNVSASIFDVDERWIFDTGCAQDLVSVEKSKFLEDQYSIEKKQKSIPPMEILKRRKRCTSILTFVGKCSVLCPTLWHQLLPLFRSERRS